jgi:hypothetical protein
MLDFSNDTQIQTEIKTSTPFQDFIDSFQIPIKTKIENGTINQITIPFFETIAKSTGHPNLSILNGIGFSKIFIAMGGTQYHSVELQVYRKKASDSNSTSLRNYLFIYKVELRDTYGADFDDINLTIKGNSNALNSFFTLQHHYSGYKPYYTRIIISTNRAYQ